jgi:hypothetical protein
MGEIRQFVPMDKTSFQSEGAVALDGFATVPDVPKVAVVYSDRASTSDMGSMQNIQYLRKKDREVVGSKAFNLEYDAPPTVNELRRDIVSYLGEYRIQVQRFPYELIYGSDADGTEPKALRDKDRGQPLLHTARRTIEERTLKNEPIHREIAEELGLQVFEEQLQHISEGTVIWASPPGPKEQGYGDYGFLFIGSISDMGNGERKLAMAAIRVEQPTIEQYNQAMSELTGIMTSHSTPEEFLQRPLVLDKQLPEGQVDQILRNHFDFQQSDYDAAMFDWIISKMTTAIDDFIALVQYGTKEQKVKAFYALENYALELKKQYENRSEDEQVVYISHAPEGKRLTDLVMTHSHEPPKAAGSCGSTASSGSEVTITSSNIFAKDFAALQRALSGEESYSFDQPGPCRVCNADAPCGPCKICEPCDTKLRKEQNPLTT